MNATVQEKSLKICHTCRYWSPLYKGLCERLQQGVGKFWSCEEWEPAAAGPGAAINNATQREGATDE